MLAAYNRKCFAPLLVLFAVAICCPWKGPGEKIPAILGALAAVAVDVNQRLKYRDRHHGGDCLFSEQAGGQIWSAPAWVVFVAIAAVYGLVALVAAV